MLLTEEQLRIINHSGGHARVSAVAGSGKTTTMVARVGHLLQQRVWADWILVLMFNKSARDSFSETMNTRLASLNCRLPEIRTFHSLGMRLVTSFTKRGVLPSYTLVTEEYVQEKLARQVANEVYREDRENEGWLSGEEVEEFLTFIDQVKSTVAGAAQAFETLGLASRYSYFVRAYELFEKLRRKKRIRFYSDLIHEPLMAMLADSKLLAWVSDRVEHIIVDEYQDINEAQQQLLKILAGSRAKVMVVGDADQCIYEWRGARPEYIVSRFQLDFPKPKNFLLSYTFRYGHQLSLAANHLISGNRKRDQKLCISHEINKETRILSVADQGKHPILSVLSQWRDGGRSLLEASVLVRLFAQSVPVELALLEAGIPYRLEGNAHVFDCPEVMALTGYMKLAVGKLADDDQESLENNLTAMFSQPHLGIKREEMRTLVKSIAVHPDSAAEILSAWEALEMPLFIRKRFGEAAKNWRWLAEGSFAGNAANLLKRIVAKTKLYEFYHNFSTKSATAENRIKTCQAFLHFAAGQNLSVLELLDKINEFQASNPGPGSETLLITSVHRAKGREWPLVVLPGLEEGTFPFYRERDGGTDDLEDERRLFYVAITRAIEQLVCIHPIDAELKYCISQCRSKPREGNVQASRFLYEANLGLSVGLGNLLCNSIEDRTLTADDTTIANQYIESIGAQIQRVEARGEDKPKGPPSEKNLEMSEIGEGMRVWHRFFGSGTVSAVKDRKQGRLTVAFEEHGEIMLLASYAKLRAL